MEQSKPVTVQMSEHKAQKVIENKLKEDDGHVMIDLETLGLRPGSIIATLGAQPFNVRTGQFNVNDAFYKRIDLPSCEQIGMTVDVSTLQWWNDPSRDSLSREEVFGTKDRRYILSAVLQEFSTWFKQGKYQYIWAKDPDFDCVLLIAAFEKLGIPGAVPWKYFNQRSVRTVRHLATMKNPDAYKIVSGPVTHHALADCHVQIQEVLDSIRVLSS